MNCLLRLIFKLLSLTSVSKVTRSTAILLNQEISLILENVKELSSQFYNNKKVFKLSSGTTFEQDLEQWMLSITKENKNLDFKMNILNKIENLDSKVVKYGMKNGIDSLISTVAIILYKHLEQHLYQYVELEIQEIKKELNGNCFFNLTNTNVPKEIKERLNLGKKYVPFFRLNKTKEINQFNSEVSSMFTSVLQNELKYKIPIHHKNIVHQLNQLKRCIFVKRNPAFKNIVMTFLKLYKEVKSEFLNSLKLAQFGFLPAMRTFAQSFNIDEERIIIEADKNV